MSHLESSSWAAVTLQRSVHFDNQTITHVVLKKQFVEEVNALNEGKQCGFGRYSVKVQEHMCYSLIRVETSRQLPIYRCASYRMSALCSC